MKNITSKLSFYTLACLALSVAISCGGALAAEPASSTTQVHISVSGMSRGYTNEDLRNLIAQGVEAALVDGQSAPTRWHFSIQAAAGNRPATQIVATMQSGNAHEVSGFFTSSSLGTAPTSLFVEEVRELARRLLQS